MKSSEIVCVHQHCFSVGKKSMGTVGIGPCLAVGGIDRENGICFLIHFDAMTLVKQTLEELYARINDLLNDQPNGDSKSLFEIAMVSENTFGAAKLIALQVELIFQIANIENSRIKVDNIHKEFTHHDEESGPESLGIDMDKKSFCYVVAVRSEHINRDLNFAVSNIMQNIDNNIRTIAYYQEC